LDIISDIATLRERLKSESKIAFVPTMGNLHEGHLSLVEIARQRAPCVVASVFVNRLQFLPHEDFDRYPRTLEQDCALLKQHGTHIVFAPDEAVLYPQPQTFFVEPPPIAHALEGEFRPGFFRGVATVVLKLFNIVQPHIAVFGKKDYQQLHLVRGMVGAFNLPIEIIAAETGRAADGLALSSRNRYLSGVERAEAARLHQSLAHIKTEIESGNKNFQDITRAAIASLDSHGWKVDYLVLTHRDTLHPARAHDRHLVALAAAWLGKTRLIDNLEITCPA